MARQSLIRATGGRPGLRGAQLCPHRHCPARPRGQRIQGQQVPSLWEEGGGLPVADEHLKGEPLLRLIRGWEITITGFLAKPLNCCLT